MKRSNLFLLMLAVVAMPGCSLDSDSCPRSIGVPFVSVDIPDSAEAGTTITLDAELYDYGCYEETGFYGYAYGDSIYLEALATNNECDCPKKSEGLLVSRLMKIDSTQRNHVVKFFYTEIFANNDSVRPRCKNLVVY